MSSNIPVAWLQLYREKIRSLVALAGITFIAILIFMQIGFQDALYSSATQLNQHLKGDIFLISAQYESLTSQQSFPRSRLFQTLGDDRVESVTGLYLEFAKLKNPLNGRKFPIYVVGVDPAKSALTFPEVEKNIKMLQSPDAVLFDRASRPEFGAVSQEFEQGKNVEIEIFNYNHPTGYRVNVVGLFSQGPSFGVDGNLIVSDSTFLRTFQYRQPENIEVGAITLKKGANVKQVVADLTAALPNDIKIFPHQQFVDFEKKYWSVRTPIGFVFSLMVTMAFVVGIVVVYQILYTNISNHLIEFATLKAIGFKDIYLLNVVFQQALLLAIFGYIPGLFISYGLYDLAKEGTHLPVIMTFDKQIIVLVTTIFMCIASGFFSINKLRSVDPVDVF